MSKLILVNKNTRTAVIDCAGTFVFIDTDKKDVIKVESEIDLSVEDGWIRVNTVAAKIYQELADAATTNLSIESSEYADSGRVFRVPRNIQSVANSFETETTTLKDIHSFSVKNGKLAPKIVQEWVSKIVDKYPIPTSLIASGFVVDNTTVYFGRGVTGNDTECDAMYALAPDGTWTQRVDGEWVPVEEDPDASYNLIMLDPESAATLAAWADKPDELDGGSIELAALYPDEAGLFFAAEADLDFEMIDMLSLMFDVYDSQERSVNAQKQVRGQGGKFGPSPGGAEGTAEAPKARMSVKLPLVENISARIDQYLAQVAQERGVDTPKTDNADPAPESGGDFTVNSALDTLLDLASNGSSDEIRLKAASYILEKREFAVTAQQAGVPETDAKPLYIAIVDDLDVDAVLDLVSLVPPARGAQGDVTAWKRAAGQWVAANEILQQLRGSTPPSVIELSDPAILKEVVEQVDKSTADQGEEEKAPGQTEVTSDGQAEPAAPAAPETPGAPVKTSNFADGSMTDGSFPIADKEDLKKAVKSFGRAKNKAKAKAHIISRARKLNATDLLPSHWDFSTAPVDLNQMAARGFAYIDGTLLVRNISELSKAVKFAETSEQQLHVVRRARALNRLDMIPPTWDLDMSTAQPLWGPYGELLPISAAGGMDKNRGGADKLLHYWTRGVGGIKIGWGTSRDWTRCVAFLSKYLGTRAKGYCALRHFEMNGYYPGDRRNK